MNMLSSAANGASAMVNRHVLCVTSNLPRWAGDSTTPFVLNLVQDLMQLGWQVDVLAPHAPNAAFQECLDGVPVERFR
jgi:phosphatidylinositol alpha-1,6-mannosyltransferase